MSGISQIGGKFRLRKRLLEFTPYHEFFLSMFCGACHYELNKPRTRYECFNDIESEIINYFLMVREHPEEFNKMKEGIFGVVSQEIANRIVNGKINPKNDLERAYFFYYLNKVTFGGTIWKIRKNPPYKGIDPSGNHIQYNKYRGLTLPTSCKNDLRGVVPKASYKGINPKTTRPWSNNDLGLLTPLNIEAIERLKYVNMTAYDFIKVYKMFYKGFFERKKLTKECFIYADPPYPGTEKYYGTGFGEKEHLKLIEILINSPFNFMLTIGGECEFYIEELKANNWFIEPVKVKYSTDANSQKESQEYICMNYDIKKVPKMIMVNQPNIINYIK